MKNLKEILDKRSIIKEKKPLIHTITNPISINFVANAILSQGALAICAEHPLEVYEIVNCSNSLSLNLGNITDVRIKSIEIASKSANKKNIPIVLDLVGIAISNLRYDFAKNLIKNYKYNVIKGNSSEIKKILGLPSKPKGIDAGKEDEINKNNFFEIIKEASIFSKENNTTLLITGKEDVLISKDVYYIIENGTSTLSKITGTGCVLGALIATYLSAFTEVEACITSLLILEISAELCDCENLGSFYVNLMDNISTISNENLLKYKKIRKGYCEEIISCNK